MRSAMAFVSCGQAPPAHEQLRAGFASDEDVLGDRHVRGERELLIDRDDAGALGVVGRREGDRLAEQLDLPRIGAVRARQDLEQGRLAGPVLAEERMDLGGPHFEMDVLERAHAREALADAGHLEDGARRGFAGADESAAGALAIQGPSPGIPCGRGGDGAPRMARPPCFAHSLHLVEALGFLEVVLGDRHRRDQHRSAAPVSRRS